MRVITGIVAIVAMLVFLAGCGGSLAQANALTPCPNKTAPWVETTNALISAGQAARAEEIYRAVLARTPTDECATKGLAALAVAPKEISKAQDVGASWAAKKEKFLTPLSEPVFAALGIFVLLLVVARLATPLFVAPDDVSWKKRWRRRLGYTTGLVLVGVAAVSLIVVAVPESVWGRRLQVGQCFGVVVLSLVVGVVGIIVTCPSLWERQQSSRPRRRPRPQQTTQPQQTAGRRLVLVVFSSLAVSGFLIVVLTSWVFVLVLLAAITGIGLIATTSGQGLRLVVEVRGTSGTSDANAAQYLLSRLTAMGSAPPHGAEIPSDADVTDLPEKALTALPDSRLAKLMVSLWLAMRPATPWRAVVSLHDATTVTIALSRNGRMTRVETFSRTSLHLPAADEVDATGKGNRHLLTAAAAHILIELSQRHTDLQRGLCGTTRSLSLAMHAIATDPAAGLTADQVRRLHTAAVADDPDSGLALVADLNRLGEDATPGQQTELAEAADAVYEFVAKIPDTKPLQMRITYTRAAARLNAVLGIAEVGGTTQAYGEMKTAVIELVDTLDADGDPKRRELRDELRRAAAYLAMTAGKMLPVQLGDKRFSRAVMTACTWVENVNKHRYLPFGVREAYDRACWRATDPVQGPEWEKMVLADLRIAVTNERLRTWARKDPSLASLRSPENGELADRFNKLVRSYPGTAFFDLPPIAPHRAIIEKIGVHDVADFLAVPPADLAEKLGVPVQIVQHWQELVSGSAG